MTEQAQDQRVARRYMGYFVDGDYKEIIDLLYCFRDAFPGHPETLEELLRTTYPSGWSRRELRAQGTLDMDALRSCSAFIYRKTSLP